MISKLNPALLISSALIIGFLSGGQSSFAQHQAPPPSATPAAPPPRIVSVSPAVGSTDVDPATSEIVVMFDRDMQGGFSWTGGGPDYPPMAENMKPHWRNTRTCVLPVKMEVGRFYRVGINSKSHGNFRSVEGVSAMPSAVYFTTKGAPKELVDKIKKPTIVDLTPKHGAANVDPKTKEIRVTFDMPMGPEFSWTGGPPSFPPIIEGQSPKWSEDKLSCTLPVRLEPNHTYQLGLNSQSARNFTSAWGVSIDPVRYTFTTAP